jgi:hypothetical protein
MMPVVPQSDACRLDVLGHVRGVPLDALKAVCGAAASVGVQWKADLQSLTPNCVGDSVATLMPLCHLVTSVYQSAVRISQATYNYSTKLVKNQC